MNLNPKKHLTRLYRFYCHSKRSPKVVLGIETSCDDTGCAIVSENGKILGECLHSQHKVHLRRGGINPPAARELHYEHIQSVIETTLKRATIVMKDVDVIAVTTKPGLHACLEVGVKYAKYLSQLYNIPLIPIHHMEAHALVARMYHKIEFPFLVLLISGGHCLIAVVKEVDKYLLLGKCHDNPPGEVLDKVARRMKLRNIPQYCEMSGGQAIEVAASKATNPNQFVFPLPLNRLRDCNFSFSGLREFAISKLIEEEKKHNILADGIIPEINDLCAAFQMAITKHLVHRIQRAAEFCELKNLLPATNKSLVISGGVACNNFIFKSFEVFGKEFGYNVYRPPKDVCTDNGVMIAWNGIEKLSIGHLPIMNLHENEISARAALGKNVTAEVASCDLSTKLIKLSYVY